MALDGQCGKMGRGARRWRNSSRRAGGRKAERGGSRIYNFVDRWGGQWPAREVERGHPGQPRSCSPPS